MEVNRCGWCTDGGIMQAYHDEEWGIPLHDDRRQFEYLVMEVMQCGLNWRMMLTKRDIFRKCFDAFDYEKIALYDERKIQEIIETPQMIRSPRKIAAVIQNAKVFIKIREEFGSFDHYLWGFSGHKTIIYEGHELGAISVRNARSDTLSKDLKRRGFKYLGSITVYSHLQACGIINDHAKECFCHTYITDNYPVAYESCDQEA